MDLFIILTLEEEIYIFLEELQYCSDVLYGHGDPAMELWVLLQLMFDGGDGRVHWC